MIGEWLAFKRWDPHGLPIGCEYCPTSTMAKGRYWGECPFTGEEWPEGFARGTKCPLVVVRGSVLKEGRDKEVEPDEIDKAMIAEAKKENTEELYELEDVKQILDSMPKEESMDIPKFMTIRQVAQTGFITEHWLRKLVAQNRVPGIYVGKRFMVNFDLFVEQLNRDSMDIVQGGQ